MKVVAGDVGYTYQKSVKVKAEERKWFTGLKSTLSVMFLEMLSMLKSL